MGMKKLCAVLAFLLLCLSMAACSPKEKAKYPTDNVYHPETDSHFMYAGYDVQMTESPDGYYVKMGDTLYFIDKKTLQASPLCGKPNCRHQDETESEKLIACDAFFTSSDCPCLEFQNGYLYVCAPDRLFAPDAQTAIVQMKPDGTERKVVATIPDTAVDCLIHRGYIYYADRVFSEEMDASYGIYRVPLDGGEKELIMPGNLQGGQFSNLRAYGNYLYTLEVASEERFDLRGVNLLTGEQLPILDVADELDEQTPYFKDGKLFTILVHPGEPENPEETWCGEYVLSDLEGKNWETVPFSFKSREENANYIIVSDGKDYWRYTLPYMGMSEKPYLFQKLDEKGNVVASIPDGYHISVMMPVLGGEDHMFLFNTTEDYHEILAVNKQPENGELKVQTCLRVSTDQFYRAITFDRNGDYDQIADRG